MALRKKRASHPFGLKTWNVTVALEWPGDEALLRWAMGYYGVRSRSAALRKALREVAGERAGPAEVGAGPGLDSAAQQEESR